VKEPNNSDQFILWLFNSRCIGIDTPCYKYTHTINEIDPRSSGKDAMRWKNRVPLCDECHHKYHDRGVSDEAKESMRERRTQRLEDLGRSEYI